MGVLGVFVNLYRTKVDRLEDRHTDAVKLYITRAELREYLQEIRDDRLRMHEENSDKLVRIDDALIRLHSRIDGQRS